MKRAAAFVPGHISGFFQVCDEASEPDRKGSRNCGPCMGAGVLTEVTVEPSDRTVAEVFINGKRAPGAQTTLAAVQHVLRKTSKPVKVVVKHSSQVPIGAGYGASAAGAFGSALALSEALGLGLARPEVVKIAHVAEVSCRTGLGDVGAQALGGLVIGLEPGAPPHGKWQQIPVLQDMKIVCGTLAPLSTKELLRGEELRDRSRKLGGSALNGLLKSPTPQDFMRVSLEFAEGLGLLDDELRSLIKAAMSAGAIGASQVMLGRAIFALVRPSEAEGVRQAFLEFLRPDEVLITDLDRSGARTVS